MSSNPLLSTFLTTFMLDLPQFSDIEVKGLQNDSRKITPGDVFIAYKGAAADGRQYIQQTIDAGAVAILYDPDGFCPDVGQFGHTPLIAVSELGNRLAEIACRFYGNPSAKLTVTGVTGTNGKTTIAYQLAQAYQLLGQSSVYIGTLGQGQIKGLQSLSNTTPDALCLQHLFHQYVQEDVQQACMEVSSHALSLGRVEFIEFQQAIYTNLSHDHLDFHQTMDAYGMAKASLFAKPTLQHAIINHDDAYSQMMQKNVREGCQLLLYGLSEGADVRAVGFETSMSGSLVEITSPWGDLQLRLQSLGQFNIYNSLAVLSSLMASEVASIAAVTEVMSQLKASPGRMEIVAQNPCVIVDYAHSPDALKNVLSTLVHLKPETLWVVFGCGGDRDRLKRPVMGRIASQYADRVILTNDNPRHEDPELILQEIRQGISSQKGIESIPDRRAAIQYALTHAGSKDIVLIAGKGHEDYQIIGDKRFAFSDQEVVREALCLI